MNIYRNIDLFQYSTMRTHSIARIFYEPSTYDELRSIVLGCMSRNEDYYILSGGSNTVFADYVSTPIISLLKINNSITITNKIVTAGCSVRIQKLINNLMDNDLGGIEYLITLPATIGGIVYMNAGRGKAYNKSIVDFLRKVFVYDPSEDSFKTIVIDKSLFSYRFSPFQNTRMIILAAEFIFPEQARDITKIKIKERMQISKKNLSADKPSCGSVFNKGSRVILHLIKGYSFGGAQYSSKTANWISNVDHATGDEVITLIKKIENLHRFFRIKYRVEIRIVK